MTRLLALFCVVFFSFSVIAEEGDKAKKEEKGAKKEASKEASKETPKAAAPSNTMKQLTNKSFPNLNAKLVHKAIEALLKDEGVKLRTTDLDGGVVAGELPRPDDVSKREYPSKMFWQPIIAADLIKYENSYDIAANVIKTKGAEGPTVRLSFQRIWRNRLGAVEGEELVIPKLYQGFWEQLQAVLDRQRATTDPLPF